MAALPHISEHIEIRYDAQLRSNTRAYTEAAGAGIIPPRPDWMVDAQCRTTDTNLFFPTHGEGPTVERAKRICAGCPAKSDCLEYALSQSPIVTGVWGGTSESERRKIRRFRGGAFVSKHGTESKYSLGCRCDDCGEAHRVYNRDRARRLRANG